jgi:hypothetical protein
MRLAGAQGDRGGSPRVENPGHTEISQRGSAGDVDFVSRFVPERKGKAKGVTGDS